MGANANTHSRAPREQSCWICVSAGVRRYFVSLSSVAAVGVWSSANDEAHCVNGGRSH
jgi:hypothetical protein